MNGPWRLADAVPAASLPRITLRNARMRTSLRLLLSLSLSLGAVFPAHADVTGVFKEAWTCAKSLPQSAYTMAKDMKEKGEAVANMSASIGVCTAQTGGQPQVLALVTSVLGGLKASKPDMLPNGQCKSRIQAQAAKPFAMGIASILPSSTVKDKLLSLAQSEQSASWIWDTMKAAPPPFGTIPSQLDCGCDLIDGSLTVADVSAVSNVIKNTSKSCAGILDEAGLGFINDWGSAAIGWTGSKYTALSQGMQKWQGKKEQAPDELVYQAFFGVYVPELSEWMASSTKPGPSPEDAWAMADQKGGWAAEAVGFCSNTMSWSNVCMIRLADMHKKCHAYFNNVVDGNKLRGKCDQWRSQASTSVAADAARLRLQANAMTVFRLKLFGWLDREWVWRLPRYNPLIASNVKPGANGWTSSMAVIEDVWKLGTFTENKDKPWDYQASGVYAAARQALVNANYNQDMASNATLAGAYQATRDATLALWNLPAYVQNERGVRLKKLMPSQPFLAAYGCPGGALSQKCMQVVDSLYEKVCHPMIRDGYVLSANVLAASVRVSKAESQCADFLKAVVDSADKLTQTGLTEVQAKSQTACPSSGEDRRRAARCVSNLTELWNQCALPQVGNVLGQYLGAAKKCFGEKTSSMKYIPLKPMQEKRFILPPGGLPKTGN